MHATLMAFAGRCPRTAADARLAVGLVVLAMTAGCDSETRPVGSALDSEKTLDRVYALEDLRFAADPSENELRLAIDYLADFRTYGPKIIGHGRRLSREAVEVEFHKDIYTTEMKRAVEERRVCDAAFATLTPRQPAAAQLAVERLVDEAAMAKAAAAAAKLKGDEFNDGRVRQYRLRLVRLIGDGVNKSRDRTIPGAMRAMADIVEQRGGNELQLEALAVLVALDDPEAVDWIIKMDRPLREGIPYQNLRGPAQQTIREGLQRRPMAFLKAFDEPDSKLARDLLRVLTAQVDSRKLSDADARRVVEHLAGAASHHTDPFLVAVMSAATPPELKQLARQRLLASNDPARVEYLIEAHKGSTGPDGQFCREAVEAALEAIGGEQATSYLSSLNNE